MNITWYGQSCFKISSKRNRNDKVRLVIDPYGEPFNLKLPKLQADILLVSHDHYDHNDTKAIKPVSSSSKPFLINTPGEYDIKEIFIQGIPAYHDDSKGEERGNIIIFTIETEGISICHLSDLGQEELTSEQLSKIGQIDILMIPVGGNYTISAKQAGKIISQIEPKIIIPMHYKISGIKEKLDGLNSFLDTMGVKSIEAKDKFSIKNKDILNEKAEIVVLKPNIKK